MDAARHWARGPAGDPDHVAAQLAEAGAPIEAIDAARAQEARERDFEVFEENVEVVDVFTALGTQWRVATGMGAAAYLGLEYQAVPPVLELMGVPPERRADTFAGLRLMEAAALPVRNAREGEEPPPIDV